MAVKTRWNVTLGIAAIGLTAATWIAPPVLHAEPPPPAQAAPAGEVTFTKDIAPILQRSCENCHRAEGVAPMSLQHLRGGAALGARDQAAHRASARTRA